MSAMSYEFFVRKAFGNVSRGGDPAGLAEADIYNTSYNVTSLNELKIGTGYAIAIYNSEYIETKELRDPNDYEKSSYICTRFFVSRIGSPKHTTSSNRLDKFC